MNNPEFDNVVFSKSSWDGMVEKLKPAEGQVSLLGGVRVVVSDFIPNDMMLLRQDEKVVAIVHIGDEAQQSVHWTAKVVAQVKSFLSGLWSAVLRRQ